MIPNIPDNFFKIAFTIGLISVVYFYSDITRANREISSKNIDIQSQNDLLNTEKRKNHLALEAILQFANKKSTESQVDNPLKKNKSGILFNPKYDFRNRYVSDTIRIELAKYFDIEQRYFEVRNFSLRDIQRLQSVVQDNQSSVRFGWIMVSIGFIVGGIGYLGLAYSQIMEDRLRFDKLPISKKFTICQSCARKMNAYVMNAKFSTNEPNYYYCIQCYRDDKFVSPLLTFDDVYSSYIKTRKSYFWGKWSISKMLARRKIANLNRWKYGEY